MRSLTPHHRSTNPIVLKLEDVFPMWRSFFSYLFVKHPPPTSHFFWEKNSPLSQAPPTHVCRDFRVSSTLGGAVWLPCHFKERTIPSTRKNIPPNFGSMVNVSFVLFVGFGPGNHQMSMLLISSSGQLHLCSVQWKALTKDHSQEGCAAKRFLGNCKVWVLKTHRNQGHHQGTQPTCQMMQVIRR